MYTTERPAEETAPSHQTVFVDRPPPAIFTPGRKLSYADARLVYEMLQKRLQRLRHLAERELAVTERAVELVEALAAAGPLGADEAALLQSMFSLEDSLIHTLYDREKEWSRTLDAIERRRSAPRQGLMLLGPVELAEPARGLFVNDGWCERELTLTLVARAPLGRLTLHGLVPDKLDEKQKLTLTLDGKSYVRTLDTGRFDWEVPVACAAGARVTVRVQASASWLPRRQGSDDVRELAYLLNWIELA
jgi:hypothetical protein